MQIYNEEQRKIIKMSLYLQKKPYVSKSHLSNSQVLLEVSIFYLCS